MVALTRRSAVGGVAAMVAGCSSGAPHARGDDNAPVRFAYGRHPSQYAELTLPTGPTPAPVVVIIPGGSGLRDAECRVPQGG
jgi:hypothetical protein